MKNIILLGQPEVSVVDIGKTLAYRLGLEFSEYDATRTYEGGCVVVVDGGDVSSEDMERICANGVLVALGAAAPHGDRHAVVVEPGEPEQVYLEIIEALSHADNPLGARYVVVGDSVSHSLSPIIHNNVLRIRGGAPDYAMARVPEGGLSAWLDYARGNLLGFCVTEPHEQDIMPFLDEASEEAHMCGAVSAVMVKDGRLVGYNIDIWGVGRTLAYLNKEFAGRDVGIIGSGGLGKATALAACTEGARSVIVAGHNIGGTASIVSELWNSMGSKNVQWAEFEEGVFKEYKPDILINTTHLGMTGKEEFQDLSFLGDISPKAIVIDLVYTPRHTKLLQKAQSMGMGIVNGVGVQIFHSLRTNTLFFDQQHGIDMVRKILAVITKEEY